RSAGLGHRQRRSARTDVSRRTDGHPGDHSDLDVFTGHQSETPPVTNGPRKVDTPCTKSTKSMRACKRFFWSKKLARFLKDRGLPTSAPCRSTTTTTVLGRIGRFDLRASTTTMHSTTGRQDVQSLQPPFSQCFFRSREEFFHF